MRQYLLNHRWIFDAGKSLPRERNECFGYNFHATAALTAGFDVDSENTFQTSPRGAYFWCAQVMAA